MPKIAKRPSKDSRKPPIRSDAFGEAEFMSLGAWQSHVAIGFFQK
jgi:hypothetical protein